MPTDLLTFPVRVLPSFTEDSSLEPQTGEIQAQVFSSTERVLRALFAFAVFLALAGASVFIPILHFLLVPAFFISAIIFGVLTLKQSSKIKIAEAPCPYCRKTTQFQRALVPTQIEGSSGETLEVFQESCKECRQLLKVEVLAP